MSGSIDFTMGFNVSPGSMKKPKSDSGYRIYILGEFSGKSNPEQAQLNIKKVDQDSLTRIMADLLPTVEIDSGASLSFASLDDFHPDVWLDKINLITDLQTLKKQLNNPETAAQATAKIQAFLPTESVYNEVISPLTVQESQEDMLQRLLGKKPETTHSAMDTVESLIQQMVAPHVSKPALAQYQELIQIIDATISQIARAILHNPKFQNLEALWRATLSLLQEEQTEQCSLFLVDINKQTLTQAFTTGGLTELLPKHIARAGAETNNLLIADIVFSSTAEDIQLLEYCHDLAKRCGGHFLAGADAGFCQRLQENSAPSLLIPENVLLAYPRYLSRLPYGPKTDPIERIDFAECDDQPLAADLLWANAAFLVARTLLRGETNGSGVFADVPVFSYLQNGDSVLQAGTETVLNEAQANVLSVSGIVPVIGFQQRQGVRVAL